MKKIVELINRFLSFCVTSKRLESYYVYSLKSLKSNLLHHAHFQLGITGYSNFNSTGEIYTLKILQSFFKTKSSMLIFDVGANDGSYTQQLSLFFPDAGIIAFEPMPETFELASKNLKDFGKVTLLKTGLFDVPGTLKLYNDAHNPNNQISSAFSVGLKDFYDVENLKEVEIPVTTIDIYCNDHGIDKIDFLKVDVEGAELPVLKGAKNIIKNEGIAFIQFEFNDFNVASRTFMKDFYDLLPEYEFYRVHKNGLIPLGPYKTELEIFKFQNILAVHNSNSFSLK